MESLPVAGNFKRNRQRMRGVERWTKWLSAASLAALVSACAGVPHDASLPINDPNEQFNRGVLHLNQVVLDPPATVIKSVPGVIRDRFQDLDANLKEPRVFANDVLQGRLAAAGITASRFVFNSLFGLGGLFDVATQGGVPQQTGDFGQTLFVWGVSEGPYTVRPYLGPSTLRDAVGSTVDMVANPVGWLIGTQVALATTQLAVTVGTTSLDAVDRLGQLKQAEDASIDFYSFIRSAYYQTRRAELREALGLPGVVESPATSELDDPGETGQSAAVAR
jgi:phospholipid-binding lipoprotein MlaA